MPSEAYVIRDGKTHGPFSPSQLKQMALAGEIRPDDLVKRDRDSMPVAAGSIAGLVDAFRESAPAASPATPALQNSTDPDWLGELLGSETANLLGRIQREFGYNTWANREVLRSLKKAQTVPDRAHAIMGHIVGAEWLWLARLGHGSPAMAVWPTLALPRCTEQLTALSGAWQRYLEKLDANSLVQKVRYTNSKGEEWSSAVADILTHVVLHSSYHRGQIATLLGQAGETAAYSDYIECIRRGHLAGGSTA
jgi:uncharacterized damage-inducible protein DinB